MSIYEHLEYREIIKNLCKRKKITYKFLAKSTGIHTSYFSRVMVEKGNFSQEQMFLIGRSLELEGEALEYFLLLGQFSSSGLKTHETYLKKQIEEIRKKKLKINELIDNLENIETKRENFINYYLDPLTAKVHMFFTIEKYRENPNLILKRLNISENKLKDQIEKLRALNLIHYKNEKVIIQKDSLNLDEDDPFSPINHTHWRLEAIRNISQRNPKLTDYHFSVVFSANDETKKAIKTHFKKYLIDVQKLVMKVERPEEVCFMNYDLFEDD